jgi:hypothetical protein
MISIERRKTTRNRSFWPNAQVRLVVRTTSPTAAMDDQRRHTRRCERPDQHNVSQQHQHKPMPTINGPEAALETTRMSEPCQKQRKNGNSGANFWREQPVASPFRRLHQVRAVTPPASSIAIVCRQRGRPCLIAVQLLHCDGA